jgi:preprotein translocase subunit SecD
METSPVDRRSAPIRVLAGFAISLFLMGACTSGGGHLPGPSAAARSRRLQLREVLGSSASDPAAMAARPFTTGVIKRDDPYRRDQGFAEAVPDGSGDMVTFEDTDGDGFYTPAADPKVLLGPVRVSGRDVTVASAVLVPASPGPDRWQVDFTLDDEGTRALHEATSKLVGKQLAIVVDGVVLSAPTVQVPITQGQGAIVGSFTEQQAKALAAELTTTAG